jgi:hypothetical protein
MIQERNQGRKNENKKKKKEEEEEVKGFKNKSIQRKCH